MVDRLRGSHRLAPDAAHCAMVGEMLARMHLAGRDYARVQPNLRGLAWWTETVPVVLPFLDRRAARADRAASSRSSSRWRRPPPTPACRAAPIHADLFRDNVMFDETPEGDVLGGFFDFYFAGVDALLFDIAVCLNDWCIALDSGRLAEDRAQAFVAAYDARAPADRRRGAADAGADARRRAALLDFAPVGPAPAARRRGADRPRPGPLRAGAARARAHAVAPGPGGTLS